MESVSAAEAGRILLLGSSGVGKHDLLSVIRQDGSVERGLPSYPWRLDNKYYTADVHFEVRHVDHCAQLQLDSAGYEAVVLVFDARQQSSFESVQRWYEAAGGSEADLGVKLAVCTRLPSSAGGEAAKPSWLLAAEDWCEEQLVEYIETEAAATEPTAAAAAAPPAQQLAAADGEGGAVGVERIREALAAHMWPGLRMKPTPQRSMAAAAAAGEQEAEAEEAMPVAGTPAAAAAGQAPAVNGVEHHPSSNGAAGSDDEWQEQDVERLEQLFAQLSSHREQLAQLPDAQRREAAAAMVMQLMAAMGLEEEDNEGEWKEEEGAEDAIPPEAA